jgi:hypothetical protein
MIPDAHLLIDGLIVAGVVVAAFAAIAAFARRQQPTWEATRYADHINDTTPARTRKWKW